MLNKVQNYLKWTHWDFDSLFNKSYLYNFKSSTFYFKLSDSYWFDNVYSYS